MRSPRDSETFAFATSSSDSQTHLDASAPSDPPPIPSATANRPAATSHRSESWFSGRTRPFSLREAATNTVFFRLKNPNISLLL